MDQAQRAAGTAADEGKHVAGVAGEEAQRVAAEAKQQARVLLEDARTQLEDQSRTQRDRLVRNLDTLGSDLDRMSMSGQTDSGLATQLVQQAAQRARDLSRRLDGKEPAEFLDDVRDFARRRPGTFLLGALAAGMVAGRLARGAQKASSSNTGSTTTTATSRPAMMPPQRAERAVPGTEGTIPETSVRPDTPGTPTMSSVPPDQPGGIR